jgi:hypothetical protein
MRKINFDAPLKVAVVSSAQDRMPRPPVIDQITQLLQDDDILHTYSADEFGDCADESFDLCFVCDACGESPILPDILAANKIPSLAIEPFCCFHPYHAAFYRKIEQLGGIRLPAFTPDEIAASIKAVRARKALRGMRLLVINERAEKQTEIKLFSAACIAQTGIEIIIKSTNELKQRVAEYCDKSADEELVRWRRDIIEENDELSEAHMRQLAKLYMAQRDMLEDAGAIGVTTDDIGGFLRVDASDIMPNASYGILVHDGYLACEEADIQVLVTELLLYAGTGGHPTMSNIYYAYRNCFDALDGGVKDYTCELEKLDTLQSFEDNHLTLAHFGSSGILPPNMMQEKRYRIRLCPSGVWKNQSMIVSTPELGKVVLARLSADCSCIHAVYGEVDGLGLGEKYGWYRGRWFIKIPSARDFAEKCLHQHYAVGADLENHLVLKVLTEQLTGMKFIGT